MGVVDTVRETAGSVAGAGAQILIEGGHAAGTLAKAVWTAPPLKIPIGFRTKKGVKEVEYIEIPPAMVLGGAAIFGLYILARQKGINPFDWFWTEVNVAKANAESKKQDAAAAAAAKETGAVEGVGDQTPPGTEKVEPWTVLVYDSEGKLIKQATNLRSRDACIRILNGWTPSVHVGDTYKLWVAGEEVEHGSINEEGIWGNW